ncbi:MAG TPA: hypothetical protein PLV59_02245 [Candidatus Dojkabacteria bacterium]|nr:hypothetical protein [Candidatus Dojkabacteria bacterium]
MKIVKTISGKELSKVGIGSYGIGGRAHRYVGEVDHNSDREYIDALINQFNVGYNFTEISAAIAGGKSADLFVKAMKESFQKLAS